jgi:hypothetical protein
MLAPTPAAGTAYIQPASPNPINDPEATFIACVNTAPRKRDLSQHNRGRQLGLPQQQRHLDGHHCRRERARRFHAYK